MCSIYKAIILVALNLLYCIAMLPCFDITKLLESLCYSDAKPIKPCTCEYAAVDGTWSCEHLEKAKALGTDVHLCYQYA